MGNSHMPETVRKLDARRRAVFPDSFSPGDSFLEEQVDEDCVVFRLIKRKSPPLVGIKKVDGELFIEVEVGFSVSDGVECTKSGHFHNHVYFEYIQNFDIKDKASFIPEPQVHYVVSYFIKWTKTF